MRQNTLENTEELSRTNLYINNEKLGNLQQIIKPRAEFVTPTDDIDALHADESSSQGEDRINYIQDIEMSLERYKNKLKNDNYKD